MKKFWLIFAIILVSIICGCVIFYSFITFRICSVAKKTVGFQNNYNEQISECISEDCFSVMHISPDDEWYVSATDLSIDLDIGNVIILGYSNKLLTVIYSVDLTVYDNESIIEQEHSYKSMVRMDISDNYKIVEYYDESKDIRDSLLERKDNIFSVIYPIYQKLARILGS